VARGDYQCQPYLVRPDSCGGGTFTTWLFILCKQMVANCFVRSSMQDSREDIISEAEKKAETLDDR